MSGAADVRVSDVFFQNSRGWCFHARNSRGVRLENVKIFSGADGIDPDGSSNVLIDRSFVHSWDDAVAVKTTRNGSNASNVLVDRTLVSTRKSALKIGTESLAAFENVTFRRSTAFDAGRGLVIYARDGLGRHACVGVHSHFNLF